jgi:hypothetical protein
MTERLFMSASAIVSLGVGLLGVIAAAPIASAVGLGGESSLVLAGRLLSASYVGYAVTDWLGRGTRDPIARRAIELGNFTGWALSFAVSSIGTAFSGLSAFGSLSLALQGVFAAGWGYVAFRRVARR